MLAVMNPQGIYESTRRGFHIQTTPLAGNHQLLADQVTAFNRGKAEANGAADDVTLSLSRVAHLAHNNIDARRKLEAAYDYYKRFDNVFTGPGIVDNGMIRPLPREQTVDELGDSLLICPAEEMIDRLGPYQELGIDRIILNVNFGASQAETLESIARIAEEVMPHFADEAIVAS